MKRRKKRERTIKDLKKDYPEEITKLDEVLFNYMGENDPIVLKIEFSDKWNYSTKKLAYLYEFSTVLMIIKKLLTN